MAEEVTVGLLVTLEAQPGKEAEVERFLDAGLTLVQQEPATTAWFGIRLGPSTYGIFDVFPDEAGREAHLRGQVAQALGEAVGQLFGPPTITRLDVLASKLPGT
jgi:quinol monooxygenase YgiN